MRRVLVLPAFTPFLVSTQWRGELSFARGQWGKNLQKGNALYETDKSQYLWAKGWRVVTIVVVQYPIIQIHSRTRKTNDMILQPPTMEALYTVQEWEELLPQLSPEMLMEVGSIVLADMACYAPSEKYFLMHLFTHSMQQRLLDTAFPVENQLF